MKCERTECTNVSNKIYRKKSHLLSLSFFCKLTAATVLKLCKEHFPTEKPWGRDRVEKCDVTLPWQPNFWISTDPFYRDGHLHHRTMEDHAIMHGKVIHFMPYMFVFSWQICKFSFPLYRARSCITVILRADFDATVRLREVIALESQENKKQNKTS